MTSRASAALRIDAPPPPGAHEAQQGAAAKARRVPLWDALRAIAFVDIVSLHVTDAHLFLGMGLPTFAILTLGLAARRATPPPTGPFLRARVRRLLLPWMAWSVLYGVLLAAHGARNHGALLADFQPAMLLWGTEQHLWFLPFAAVAGAVVHALDLGTRRLRTARLVPACFAGALALAVLAERAPAPEPLRMWMFAAPAVLIGLGIGRMAARPAELGTGPWWGTAAGAFAVALALAWTGAAPTPAFRFALATGLIALGPLCGPFPGRWAARVEPLLYGAYLAHAVVYSQAVTRVEALAGVSLSGASKVLATVIASLVVVTALKRTPLRSLV